MAKETGENIENDTIRGNERKGADTIEIKESEGWRKPRRNGKIRREREERDWERGRIGRR